MFEYLKLFYYLLSPKSIFLRRNSHGLGDNLLLSILLPILKERYPDRSIIVETEWPDLFKNNPYATWVTGKHFSTTKRHIRPKYKIDEATTKSFSEQLTKFLGVELIRAPEMYLSAKEVNEAKKQFPFRYLVICPEGKQSFSANRKEWGFTNFQELVNLFDNVKFVQIGSKNDKLLENAIDARGLKIRKSAAVINNSMFFLGLEGGLMHVTKALGKRAVILYGGYIKPEISGYNNFINLYNSVECSPCCNSDRAQSVCNTMECFDGITPEFVNNKILEEGLLNEN